MRANFVDRLLARVDGEVAPIWITQILTTPAPPALPALRAAVRALVDEVDRLQLAWDHQRADWVPARRGDADIEAAVTAVAPTPLPALITRVLAAPVDLGRALPLRLVVAPPGAGHRLGAIVLQLHHAIGDARSLMFVNARLWQLLSGTPDASTALGPARLRDRTAVAAALRRFPALAALRRAEHRILARRGAALTRRAGDEVGAPMLRSLRVPLPVDAPGERRSALFFGAVLAAIVAHGTQGAGAPVRLRIPVDLRRELGLGRSLENACSAVPVELGLAAIERALTDPEALGRLVPDALRGLLARGVHWATLLECLAVSRIASTAALRRHTRPELLAALRGSTMVTTYVGAVDRYFADAPFPIDSLRTHTPTWGANALGFAGALMINVGGFDRLWSPDDLDRFVAAMQRWLTSAGAASEVL